MIYNYKRRISTPVKVRNIIIGGDAPIRLQSMVNIPTLETEAAAAQAAGIAAAGGELVRLTTQGERHAENMANIRAELDRMGCDVPLVADVHFNPKAAYVAAGTCDKVRINPGNFVDVPRQAGAASADDPQRIREALMPLIAKCREHHTALRLGINHGSLSQRIVAAYGDTPEGMVVSAMEFLRILRDEDFHDVVISIKSSNVVVMVRTVRLLAETMAKEGMAYPLHLGVTEAGDGEDGRVKSAVGIGTLLGEGLGDTIRVSLTEDPENEIPVARILRDYIAGREGHKPVAEPFEVLKGDSRIYADPIPEFDATKNILAIGADIDTPPADWHVANAGEVPFAYHDRLPVVLRSEHSNPVGEIASWIDRFVAAGGKNPIIIKLSYGADNSLEDVQIKAGSDFGALLLNGYGSGIWLDAPALEAETRESLSLSILQAARLRISKTEYIACPGCGRTLFDLQQTLTQVRNATRHLKGLKIGVMGCIVNGPGEMADADYGYVGAGPGRVSLYKGQTLVEKNIPAEMAVARLLELINNDRG